jgi:hypothetical protein
VELDFRGKLIETMTELGVGLEGEFGMVRYLFWGKQIGSEGKLTPIMNEDLKK